MKNKYFLTTFLLLFSGLIANATIRTVSNSPLSVGQYTDLQVAITASASGDTVYVHGSPIAYGNVTINRRITLIGAGYKPTNTQYNVGTFINNITLDSTAFNVPIFNSRFIGLGFSYLTVSDNTGGILIERCYGNITSYGGNGWIIQNNIISILNIYGPTPLSSFLVRNNIFLGYINANVVASGLLIDHNVFLGSGAYVYSTSYATISNNIFYNSNQSVNGSLVTFCSFTKNLTVYSAVDNLPYGNNTGTGNFNNADPANLFNGTISVTTYPAITGYDFTIKTGSPADNSATDGTDLGIYGGAKPMPNLTGAPPFPQVTLLNINNTSVPLNGTLNYQLKARIQN
jgi:hypothetical protein